MYESTEGLRGCNEINVHGIKQANGPAGSHRGER